MDSNVDEIVQAVQRARARRANHLDDRLILDGMRNNLAKACATLGREGAVDACHRAIDMLMRGDFDESDFVDRETLDTLERTLRGMSEQVAQISANTVDSIYQKSKYHPLVQKTIDVLQDAATMGLKQGMADQLMGRVKT